MPSIHAEQLSRLRAIIKAEVEKPGSRGGVVVGTWPSGRPKYLSELKGFQGTGKPIVVELGKFEGLDARARRERGKEAIARLAGTSIRNAENGWTVGFRSARNLKKAISGMRSSEELAALDVLPAIVHVATESESVEDRKRRPQIAGFHYLEAPLTIGAKDYTAYIAVREVKAGPGKENEHVFYTHFVREGRPGSQPADMHSAQSIHPAGVPGSPRLAEHDEHNKGKGNSQSEKRKSLILGPIIGMTVQKAKGLSQRRCPFCQGWKGTVVRVFESYDDFASSPYYGGGDLVINDPHATRAVWPGKDNVGRPTDDWWICIPVHPYCGCHWQPWSPPVEEDEDDPWVQFRRRGKEGATQEDNRRAFQEERARFRAENPHLFKSAAVTHGQQLALLREAIRTPAFRKSTTDVSGVFHHHTCAHEDETESWTRSYLRSRRTA